MSTRRPAKSGSASELIATEADIIGAVLWKFIKIGIILMLLIKLFDLGEAAGTWIAVGFFFWAVNEQSKREFRQIQDAIRLRSSIRD